MRDFDWSILSTLYRTKNITKAAEMLYITQPTLTRRLQQIETELGAVLILRTNKGVTFTPEGEYAALKAAEILDSINSIKSTLSQSHGELRGTLRLGAPNSFVHFVVPALIEQFSLIYPHIQIDLHTDLSHELLRYLENQELDVSFVRGDFDTTLEKKHLSSDQIYIISKNPIILSELPNLPQIAYTKENSIVKASKRWWQERFTTPPNVRFRVHTGDACIQLIKKNLGYGIFSDGRYFNPADGLHALSLEYLDGSRFTRNSWMVYDKSSLQNPVVSHFIEFVSQHFEELCGIPVTLHSHVNHIAD